MYICILVTLRIVFMSACTYESGSWESEDLMKKRLAIAHVALIK